MRALLNLSPMILLAVSPLCAQQDLLRSGPMLGYSEMVEVLLWVQTTRPAEVVFAYWDVESPGVVHETDAVRTSRADAFVARAVADRVQPGRRYAYEIRIDGAAVERPYPLTFQTQELWEGRGDPPEFRIAAGSCFYVNDAPYDPPGDPKGGEYGILEAMAATRPDAMVWLGDNVYLLEPDWGTRTGMIYRYSRNRALPELQPLLASVHHYATWDDHDYGPDNSDWTWREKETSREVFQLFWGNPEPGPPEMGGITTTFRWADAEFFLLDNRWFRSSEHRVTGVRQVFGDEQLRWLIDAITASRASFKIIVSGGMILTPVAAWDSYASYPVERERFLEELEANRVSGVIILSGDVHYTVLSKLERPGTYSLWEVTSSPLTARVADLDPATYENPVAEPGTLFVQRNFATLDFAGPLEDRRLTVTVRDVAGDPLWSKEIRARDLVP